VNELPDGWTVEPFEQVARYAAGRTPARANPSYWLDDGDSVPWVAISDMRNYGTVTSTAETISGKAFREVFNSRVAPAGTMLMSFKLTIGRIAVLGAHACHNEAIISIFPRADVDQRYLGYFLSQVDFSEHHDRQVKGNTLNRSKIDRIPICLPKTKNEQRAIADVLDRVRSAIQVNAATEQTASALKHAAMRALFGRGLREEPPRESEVGLVPVSWCLEPLEAHYDVASGTTPSRTNAAFWHDGTIPWVKTTEVDYCVIHATEEHIAQAALDQRVARVFPARTLLLAMYGQGVTRGKVALLGIDASCNQACAAITARDGTIDPKYLYQFLAWRYEAIRRRAHGGQQQNLNLDIVRGLPIAFPDHVDEQRAIVAILDAIDLKIGFHKNRRATLETLFDALLHALMTGSVRVDELDQTALGELRTRTEGSAA
jgi:type I restriction enzyme S subunit